MTGPSKLLVATAAMLFAACTLAEETTKIDQRALLQRMADDQESLVILDVRTPEEYAAGHVPGAVNVPYTHLPARISELQATDKDIVVYCGTGIRAENAASRLRANGFTRLLHLDGDMAKWEENKRPVEK